jgi:hypothetical protein
VALNIPPGMSKVDCPRGNIYEKTVAFAHHGMSRANSALRKIPARKILQSARPGLSIVINHPLCKTVIRWLFSFAFLVFLVPASIATDWLTLHFEHIEWQIARWIVSIATIACVAVYNYFEVKSFYLYCKLYCENDYERTKTRLEQERSQYASHRRNLGAEDGQ